MHFADLALARKLEGVEAAGNAAAAEATARLRPESSATWIPVGGGRAMFVGVDSPITQAFGLGLHGPVTEAEMDQLEEFFRSRGSGVLIEVCPLADGSLVELLGRRGYRPLEFSNVIVRALRPAESFPAAPSGLQVRRVTPAEAELYTRTVAEGFFGPEIPPNMLELIRGFFGVHSGTAFLAWLEGRPAGGGAMAIFDGVAHCSGDATPAAFRGRGVQAALIQARLAAAAAAGCELAMAATQCGSVSQRNYERLDFHVAYTRCKFIREWS